MAAATPGHFSDLDGIRGLLALGVALLHLGINSFTRRTFGWPGVTWGLAVDFFFLLSGYVLTHAGRRGIEPIAFALKRFLRLAPVFYVTTLVAAVGLAKPWAPAEYAMAQPVLGRNPANFASWSVTWELVLPVLAAVQPWRVPDRWVRPLLVLLLMAGGGEAVGVAMGIEMPLWLPRAATGLLAGHLLYRAGLAVPFGTIAPFGLSLVIMALATIWPPSAFLLPITCAATILAGRNRPSLLSTMPFQLLGQLSYTLYLAHLPMLFLARRLFGEAIDANAVAKCAILGAALGFASLLTLFVERPTMRLAKYLGRVGHAGGTS